MQPPGSARIRLDKNTSEFNVNNFSSSKTHEYMENLLNIDKIHAYISENQVNVEVITSNSKVNEVFPTCNHNTVYSLPQVNVQTNEVSHNAVSQNVFNPASCHCVSLQSNSKSAQNGVWCNIGGGIDRDVSLASHFSYMTKKECPCISDGLTICHVAPYKMNSGSPHCVYS